MTRQIEGLLSEIEEGLRDETQPTATLLRKCLLLGGYTNSIELREWAQKELNGYPLKDPLPEYRQVPATLKVKTNSRPRRRPISLNDLPDVAREVGFDERLPLSRGAAELERDARSSQKWHRFSVVRVSEVISFMNSNAPTGDAQIENIYWEVSSSALIGVVDHIRTALTTMVAELIAATPAGTAFPTEQAVAKVIATVTISGEGNTVSFINGQDASRHINTAEAVSVPLHEEEGFFTRWRNRGIAIGIAALVTAAVTIFIWLDWQPWK